MKPRLREIATGILCLLLWLPATSPRASDSTETPFDSFRIVIDRNIFSPDRHRVESREHPFFEVPSPEPTEREGIVLVGALIYEGTSVAFFDGTRSDYRAALRRGETIAGYRLTEIGTESVKLERGEEQVDLPVGSGLSRQRDGQWAIDTGSFDRARLGLGNRATAGQGTQSDSDQTSTRGETADSSSNDMLRRLMERRKRELEQ